MEFLLFTLCGEDNVQSSTIRIAFDGDDRGRLAGEEKEEARGGRFSSPIDVARGSKELESG